MGHLRSALAPLGGAALALLALALAHELDHTPRATPPLRLELRGLREDAGFLRANLLLINGLDRPCSFTSYSGRNLGDKLRLQVRERDAWRDAEPPLFHGPHPAVYSCSRGYRSFEVQAGEREVLVGYLTPTAGTLRVGVRVWPAGEDEARIAWSAPFRSL